MRKIAWLGTRAKLDESGLSETSSLLEERDIESKLVFLDKTDDLAHELLDLKRSGFDRALACGGDGTLHLVIEALAKLDRSDRLPIGVVPLGTANDFAKGIGADRGSLEETLLTSALAPVKGADIGWVNGHPFVNVASGGGVARATTDLPPQLKSIFGRYAYHINALLKFGQLPEYHVAVRGDGWMIQETCIAFTVGNNSNAGGGFKIAPEARLDDGRLDFLLIPSQSVLELTALAAEFRKDRPDLDRFKVFYKQASDIFLDSAEELQVNLDGEPIRGRQFHFRVEPLSIDLVSP